MGEILALVAQLDLVLKRVWFLNHATEMPEESETITVEEATTTHGYSSKVKGIREVLARNHMKVAFFGRFVLETLFSSGKNVTRELRLPDPEYFPLFSGYLWYLMKLPV